MALNNLLCHIRAFHRWNETWLWIRGKKKILTDSSNSFWIARSFFLPGRLASMYIHPQNPERQIQSIRQTRRRGIFGFLKAQEEWYENNSISYVSLCCCCVLPNTAESANTISSASACRRAQKYCVGITQHMFKAGRWQVQSGAKKQLLYVMHSWALEYLFSGFNGCWNLMWVSELIWYNPTRRKHQKLPDAALLLYCAGSS